MWHSPKPFDKSTRTTARIIGLISLIFALLFPPLILVSFFCFWVMMWDALWCAGKHSENIEDYATHGVRFLKVALCLIPFLIFAFLFCAML